MQKNKIDSCVHIVGEYYMTADANQYVLIKRVVRTSREDMSTYDDVETVGYYASIQSLCKKAIQLCVREKIAGGEVATLREVAREFDALTTRLEDAIQF